MKEIFKVGDKVYDCQYGWGIIKDVDKSRNYPIEVKFACNADHYTIEGELIKGCTKTLSFTEYTLKGFSQERPIVEKIVVTTEYNAFEDKFYGLVVIQGRQGSHPLYDVVYNGGCRDEYFDTEEEAREKAEYEAIKIKLI